MEQKPQKKRNKKRERLDKRSEDLKELQKKLDEMVENMKTVMGDDYPDLKIVDQRSYSPRNILRKTIIEIILSIILLFAISGYIKWVNFDSIWYLLLLFGTIIIIEFILKFFIEKYFIKLIIYSFGTINLLPSIIGYIVGCLCLPGLNFPNFWLILVCYLIYVIIKKVTMLLLEPKGIKLIRR